MGWPRQFSRGAAWLKLLLEDVESKAVRGLPRVALGLCKCFGAIAGCRGPFADMN